MLRFVLLPALCSLGEVFVPVRDSTEHTNYVALFGALAQILASAVPTFLPKMTGDAVDVRLAGAADTGFSAASWNGTSTVAIIVVVTR